MKINLHVVEIAGNVVRKTFAIENGERMVFGRSSHCVGRLTEDDRISRRHFRVEVHLPEVKLRDLGSRHGTFVRDQSEEGEEERYGIKKRKIGKKYSFSVAYLGNGDKIRAGKTLLEADIPTCCWLCNGTIPEENKKVCQIKPGIYLCVQCTHHQVPAKILKQINTYLQCSSCGQNIAEEIPNPGAGAYICKACRKQAVHEITMMQGLLTKTEDVWAQKPGVISDYQLHRLLGIGSMGVVYSGRKQDNTKIAIKIMLPKIAARAFYKQQFLENLSKYHHLKHSNIISYLDFGFASTGFYLVQEYCKGHSVAHLLANAGGKLPLEQVKNILIQALEGLIFLHQQKIFHRDLKPHNLLLTEANVVKIGDWFISNEFENMGFSNSIMTGMIGDLPGYMPREQLANFEQMNASSDVWSLAAIGYLMITGSLPRNFQEDIHPLAAVLEEDVVPILTRNPNISQKWAEVIDRGLKDNMEERYSSAQEFLKALKSL